MAFNSHAVDTTWTGLAKRGLKIYKKPIKYHSIILHYFIRLNNVVPTAFGNEVDG